MLARMPTQSTDITALCVGGAFDLEVCKASRSAAFPDHATFEDKPIVTKEAEGWRYLFREVASKSGLEFGGIGVWTEDDGAKSDRWNLLLPAWFMVLSFAVLPSFWLFARLRRGGVADESIRCPACGYDLRATPERCPECGAEA